MTAWTSSRPAVARSVEVAGFVILVILVAVLATLYAVRPSSVTTTTTTATSSQAPFVVIFRMYGDVNGPAASNLKINNTNIGGNTVYLASVGQTLDVTFTITYAGCTTSCPTHVTNVTSETPGFTVEATGPGLPIGIENPPGTPSSESNWSFIVFVRAPNDMYNGQLVLLATMN